MPEQDAGAIKPAPSIASAQPQTITIPRVTSPKQPGPQPNAHHQSPVADATGHQPKPNCPRCGAGIEPASGRCTGCGLLYGSRHRVMQQQVSHAEPPASFQSVPRPQSSITQQSPRAYSTRPHHNYPPSGTPLTSFRSPPKYGSPGAAPYGMAQPQLPRAAPVAVSAMPAPARVPMRAKPYPYQAMRPMPSVRGMSQPTRQALVRISVILFILLACFFVGTGVYYTVTQIRAPSPSYSPVDSTPPNIQGVSTSSITETSAVITWKTDKPATSQVMIYDSNGVCTQTEPEETQATDHYVTLSGLKPNATYQYTVISKDAAGNEATSKGTLVTLAKADAIPPEISEVNVSSVTETSATIMWTTNEPATGQVKYGKTEAYGSTLSLDAKRITNHSVTISGLTSDTNYYFKITVKDASGNEAEKSQQFKTSTPIPVGCQVGNRAPEFTLKDVTSGQDVTLNAFRGKIVMVNFWATWCSPCVSEMPHFQAVFDSWSREKLVVLAIAVKANEDLTSVKQYITQKGYTFPVLFDSEGAAAANYDANRLIPQTFFIDANGIIQKVKEGNFYSKDEIENILKSL